MTPGSSFLTLVIAVQSSVASEERNVYTRILSERCIQAYRLDSSPQLHLHLHLPILSFQSSVRCAQPLYLNVRPHGSTAPSVGDPDFRNCELTHIPAVLTASVWSRTISSLFPPFGRALT
jgi:hypothetical protein